MNSSTSSPGAGEYSLEITNNSDEATIGLTYDFELITPDPVLSFNGSFNETLANNETLARGEHDYFLLRSLSALNFEMTATFGEDEEGLIRVINLTNDQSLQTSGTEEATLSNPTSPAGIYLIEVQALTELATGHGPRATGHGPRATGHGLRATPLRFPATKSTSSSLAPTPRLF